MEWTGTDFIQRGPAGQSRLADRHIQELRNYLDAAWPLESPEWSAAKPDEQTGLLVASFSEARASIARLPERLWMVAGRADFVLHVDSVHRRVCSAHKLVHGELARQIDVRDVPA
ncbi:MAG TPA: hypothetical protein VGC45_07365 [Gryllotalpicola sp.]